MPRQARLDAPGTLHHVIIRGIEKRRIVIDDIDRNAFVTRLGALATDLQTPIYAWALLTNHAHLLLRSGPQGLSAFMRRLLTGYAQSYNRRHRRHGHLFQNRYKSIVCEDDAYFQELVRYIHLNPLRAQIVPTLAALATYSWCGHRSLFQPQAQPWQAREAVLARFGASERTAKRAYQQYMQDGVAQGRRPELVGGGLVRSRGGWAAVVAQRQRGDRAFTDERVLGSGEFVERLVQEAEERLQRQLLTHRTVPLRPRLEQACEAAGVSLRELQHGSRRQAISQLRAQLAREFVEEHGLPLAEVARHLGVTTAAICKLLQRQARALKS